MSMLHKYSLNVKWNNKPDWNITILAMTTEMISMWLPKEETEDTYIISVEIKLLEKNVETYKNYIAKGID